MDSASITLVRFQILLLILLTFLRSFLAVCLKASLCRKITESQKEERQIRRRERKGNLYNTRNKERNEAVMSRTTRKRGSPCNVASTPKGGYTIVTLPRTVTPYRDSVDGTRDHVTYQKLVTR
jgi:hypothetical protein